MMRLVRPIFAGCCCAALVACGAPTATVSSAPSHPQASLPHPSRAWNEDFASEIELDTITVGTQSVLVPEGVRVPADARVTASTEAMLVMTDDDPAAVRSAVERSAAEAGYERYAHSGKVTVWVGRGMAVRLEADAGVQVLAWGPDDMKDAFAAH